MSALLLLLALTAAPAQDTRAPPEDIDATCPLPEGGPDAADPEALLRAAECRFGLKSYDAARDLFERLLQRAALAEDVPADVQADALMFLGELHHVLGRDQDAEATFRLLLGRFPEYRASTVRHYPPTVTFLEEVRRSLIAEQGPLQDRPRPFPLAGLAPFGVPQLTQRQPVRGALYATLQAGALATSLASMGIAIEINRKLQQPSITVRTDLAERRDDWKTVGHVTAAATYAFWLMSVVDGAVVWRRGRTEGGATLLPTAGGAAVAVSGRF